VRRRRTLIAPPLTWEMNALPVPPPAIPVLAECGGTQLKTPKPVLIIDTREQDPLDFSRFRGWFAGIERRALQHGDYSLAGMEDVCAVERKELSDLVQSFSTGRAAFVERLRAMSRLPHRLLVITAPLSRIKSPYEHSKIDPNRVLQSLVAGLAGLGIPFLCTDTHELGEEVVASYLYQIFLYNWLQSNGHGDRLVDNDL
jgi:ERCC4-type nuclease